MFATFFGRRLVCDLSATCSKPGRKPGFEQVLSKIDLMEFGLNPLRSSDNVIGHVGTLRCSQFSKLWFTADLKVCIQHKFGGPCPSVFIYFYNFYGVIQWMQSRRVLFIDSIFIPEGRLSLAFCHCSLWPVLDILLFHFSQYALSLYMVTIMAVGPAKRQKRQKI